MKLLGKEPKNWVLEFKNPEREGIYITRSTAENIQDQLRARGKFINFYDGEGNLSEIIDKNEIKSIKRTTEPAKEDIYWVCGWGTRHKMGEGIYKSKSGIRTFWTARGCGCEEKFGISEYEFMDWIRMFYKVNYAYHVKEEMQKEFLISNEK